MRYHASITGHALIFKAPPKKIRRPIILSGFGGLRTYVQLVLTTYMSFFRSGNKKTTADDKMNEGDTIFLFNASLVTLTQREYESVDRWSR